MTQVVQVRCLPLHEPHQSRRCTRHHINSINELVGSLRTHKHRMVKIRPVFVEMIETSQTWIICPCPWPSVPISQGQRRRNKRTGNGTRTEGQTCNEHITNCMYTHLSFCTIVSTTAPTYVTELNHDTSTNILRPKWTERKADYHVRQRIQCTYIVFPYRETFKGENFCKLAKNTIFVEKTFANSHKTAKFAKVFSLKSFPLYGTCIYTGHTHIHTHYQQTSSLRLSSQTLSHSSEEWERV